MRMIDLSTYASRTKLCGESGKYHSATKSIATSRLPTKKKYRPKGTWYDRRVSWSDRSRSEWYCAEIMGESKVRSRFRQGTLVMAVGFPVCVHTGGSDEEVFDCWRC